MPARRILPPSWRREGRLAPDGTFRPMSVTPGTEAPWVRMGPARLGQVDMGQVDASELERGQVMADQVTGVTCLTPDPDFATGLPFLAQFRGTGSRGAPLTLERPLVVLPANESGPQLEPKVEPPPSTNLTRVWPQLYPPGRGGGERPQTQCSASTVVGAGATVNLVVLPELPRGMAAVIKKFGQTAQDFTNLVWTFLIKGRPADPIVAINFQFGQLFLPVDLPGTGVELGPGDDFVVQVFNGGGAGVAGVRARVDLFQYQLFGAA